MVGLWNTEIKKILSLTLRSLLQDVQSSVSQEERHVISDGGTVKACG